MGASHPEDGAYCLAEARACSKVHMEQTAGFIWGMAGVYCKEVDGDQINKIWPLRLILKGIGRTSLVVQWLGICLPMKGAQV